MCRNSYVSSRKSIKIRQSTAFPVICKGLGTACGLLSQPPAVLASSAGQSASGLVSCTKERKSNTRYFAVTLRYFPCCGRAGTVRGVTLALIALVCLLWLRANLSRGLRYQGLPGGSFTGFDGISSGASASRGLSTNDWGSRWVWRPLPIRTRVHDYPEPCLHMCLPVLEAKLQAGIMSFPYSYFRHHIPLYNTCMHTVPLKALTSTV